MQPSEKYAVDYTDGNGLKWSKQISQMYTTLGNIDMSAAISSFNDPLVKTVYRKSRTFNPVYDNAITYASVGHDSLVMKYFARNAYPTDEITSGTVIIDHASPDGISYATGVNEDASVPYNGGMSTSRVLVDTEYNKMLFKVTLREMTLGTSDTPIPNSSYNDPTYTDVQLKDIDDNKWYGLFYHNGAKVWNGSSWVDANLAPVLICNGGSTQSFQGGGSAFNNLFNNYNGTMGSGQNIEFTNAASNYYWTAHNFVNRMNIDNYSLGWSDSYDYKPSFADNFDAMKAYMLGYLTDNNYSPWQSVWFQLCREVHQISNDMSVLLTVFCYACLDSNNNLFINWDNTYTFPIIKGSSVSKFLAGYGLYYLTDSNADLTDITPDTLHNSSAIWVGEMSADGTTTGRWIKGADIENYTGYNKDGNINNPDFDPSGGGGGEESFDSDPSAYNDAYTTGVPSSQLYAMTLAQVNDMFSKLTNGGIIPANFEPGNAVISIQRYPFSLSSFASAVETNITWTARPDVIGPETPTRIMFPPTGEEIKGYPIYNPVKRVSLGSFKLSEFWTNYIAFLNREISASLYIPFCGIIEIDINAILNKTITVYLTIDVISGGCTAAVDINGCMYTTVSGSCSADMYFSTSNYGTIRAALRSNTAEQVYNVAQLAAGAIGAAATGGLTAGWATQAATGAGFNILGKAIKRTMMRNGVTPSVHGSAGDMSGWKLPMHCQLILSLPRPNHSSDSIYGHSHGFLTVSEKTVGSCSGLAVCDNPDVSNIGTATDTEKEMIYNMLQNGVYV